MHARPAESTDVITNSILFSTPFQYPSESETQTCSSADTQGAVLELLAFLDKMPHGGIAVACLRLCLGKEERSEQEIANRFGVTKAAVSKTLNIIRDRYALKPRCGRSEKARKVFAVKRLNKKRNTKKWQRLSLFRAA